MILNMPYRFLGIVYWKIVDADVVLASLREFAADLHFVRFILFIY